MKRAKAAEERLATLEAEEVAERARAQQVRGERRAGRGARRGRTYTKRPYIKRANIITHYLKTFFVSNRLYMS